MHTKRPVTVMMFVSIVILAATVIIFLFVDGGDSSNSGSFPIWLALFPVWLACIPAIQNKRKAKDARKSKEDYS